MVLASCSSLQPPEQCASDGVVVGRQLLWVRNKMSRCFSSQLLVEMVCSLECKKKHKQTKNTQLTLSKSKPMTAFCEPSKKLMVVPTPAVTSLSIQSVSCDGGLLLKVRIQRTSSARHSKFQGNRNPLDGKLESMHAYFKFLHRPLVSISTYW